MAISWKKDKRFIAYDPEVLKLLHRTKEQFSEEELQEFAEKIELLKIRGKIEKVGGISQRVYDS